MVDKNALKYPKDKNTLLNFFSPGSHLMVKSVRVIEFLVFADKGDKR
jgi:hypothetical protein